MTTTIIRPISDNAILRAKNSDDGTTNLYSYVDEEVASDSDYVKEILEAETAGYAIFNFENISLPVNSIINKITLFARVKSTVNASYDLYGNIFGFRINTHSTNYSYVPTGLVNGSFTDITHELINNPYTSLSWTQEEINNLIYGFSSSTSFSKGTTVQFSQLYIEIDYSSQPTVTTEAVSNISYTTSTGNGTVVSEGATSVTERGICWSTSENPTTADSKGTSAGTTGSYTVDMTGLSPETLYHARAYAINSIGTSYGDDVTFTTLRALPTVTTQAVSGIYNLSATGNGTVTLSGASSVSDRGIVWNTLGTPTTSDNKTSVSGTTGAFTADITGLARNTAYHTRAYAINSYGTAYGSQEDFTSSNHPELNSKIIAKNQTPYSQASLSVKGTNLHVLKYYLCNDGLTAWTELSPVFQSSNTTANAQIVFNNSNSNGIRYKLTGSTAITATTNEIRINYQ